MIKDVFSVRRDREWNKGDKGGRIPRGLVLRFASESRRSFEKSMFLTGFMSSFDLFSRHSACSRYILDD